MKKRRTIPQIDLLPLSGDCTLCVFDDVTLNAIITLWGTTLYPNTFTYKGREFSDLNATDKVDFVACRRAILDDFEAGIMAGCNVSVELQEIAGVLRSLQQSVAGISNAVYAASCCGNGGVGLPDYTGTQPTPDPEQSQDDLCRKLRYAQWLTRSWLDRYVTPVLSLGFTEILAALGTSLALPPYGTEIPETAAGIILLVASFGANVVAETLEDVIPVIFDDLYCVVVNGELPSEGGIRGWIYGKINEILDNPAYAQLLTWVIGASGGMLAAINAITGILDVPDGFVGDPCPCEGDGGFELVSIAPDGYYNPDGAVGQCGGVGLYSAFGGYGVVSFSLGGWLPSHRTVTVIYSLYTTLQLGSITLTVNGQSVEQSGNECAGEITITVDSEIITAIVTFAENADGSGVDCRIDGVSYV